jgi:hypothetical protein
VPRGFQFLAGTEMVRLQHLLDPAVETLRCPAMVCLQTMRGGHAIGLRVLPGSQAMLDAEVTAQLIELMLAGGSALAQAKQAVGKLLAIVHCPAMVWLQAMRGGENGPDPHWAGSF